ncbi:TadE/TadG family type IV pilus assembly protein [Phytohabitans houttuyneae]|uniref:TadE/TadG family type IV pilus assembly protein n=1 Tax=Phytohabitans houttuyneae TaxID=1076126 RepID=UPI002483B362|nr:TadE/TadG family type IV pilus assembly protein [Phytohabitans houttuyneae]
MTQPGVQDRSRPGRPRLADRGSATVQMTAALPLLLLLLAFALFAGRVSVTRIDANAAASAAARAASQQRQPATAPAAAERAAHAALAGKGVSCATLTVDTDTSAFWPGGVVSVSILCRLSTQALTGLRMPGSVVLRATAISPIDTWRADEQAAS